LALREREIANKLTRSAPANKEEARAKAEFDSNMKMIAHHVDWAESPEAAEYFFRQLMKQCRSLSDRFGLKIA